MRPPVPDALVDSVEPTSANSLLVWIHGGGYVQGSKTNDGNPAGLIKASNDSLIFVAINYRLGAFGWLSGPGFQKGGGVSNAALYDQRFALQWVQDHIADFGGDVSRVTVMGESAGGGSIMHQITVSVAFPLQVALQPGFRSGVVDINSSFLNRT